MRTPKTSPDLSVVVPLAGESSDRTQIAQIAIALENSDYTWELLLVGSEGNLRNEVLVQYFSDDPRIRFLLAPPHGALIHGARASRGKFVLTTSMDLPFGATVLVQMAETLAVDSSPSVWVSPYATGGSEFNAPPIRKRVRRWANFLLARLNRLGVTDFSGRTRGYRERLWNALEGPVADEEFHSRLLLLLTAAGRRPKEIPGRLRWGKKSHSPECALPDRTLFRRTIRKWVLSH